jgi:hypothetical protein
MEPRDPIPHDPDVGIGKLVMDDVRRGKLAQAYRRDLRDIYRFYLTDAQRERLAGMRAVKRFFWIAWWLARNLLLRLSPSRRVLLVLAMLIFAFRPSFEFKDAHFSLDLSQPAFLILLVDPHAGAQGQAPRPGRDRGRPPGPAVAAASRPSQLAGWDIGARRLPPTTSAAI